MFTADDLYSPLNFNDDNRQLPPMWRSDDDE